MKSVMAHQFSQVPQIDIPRSSFDRSHGHKTTFDGGYLIPFYVDEVLPGDTFNLNATLFCRMATQIVPIMDNLFLETFFFAVPLRLVWDNFQKFMGEQANPGDSTDYLVPQIYLPAASRSVTNMDLFSYFGIPYGVGDQNICAFWSRAYNLIWNEWFRDQNLQDSVVVDKGDSTDDIADYVLLKRGKRHDYFTSALPWPQKGPGVELPLGATAPVVSDGTQVEWAGTSGTSYPSDWANVAKSYPQINANLNGQVVKFGDNTGLEVDLSTATAATINSLREAFQLQKMLERDARGGTRYTELIKSHFGTTSPDARLQRPEFLGGSSTRINSTPVAQTASTYQANAMGDLAAYATAIENEAGFTKSFTEHCVLIGLVNVRADLTYQKGIHRMFNRSTRYDFYWPALAHLGEQEILNKEIYAQGTSEDDEVFGYQERWAEYRYGVSKITGKLNSHIASTVDYWHLSQEFGSLPVLNDSFIQDNPPLDRCVAVTYEPKFVLDSYFDLKCVRPMPTYSVPGMIDHF